MILAGGAFNTPQLLMLSGIGDPDVLGKYGIRTRVPLRGVGRNLQDRYEVPVVNRMVRPWEMLEGATFTTSGSAVPRLGDAAQAGIYTTNGALLSRRAALGGRQAGAGSVLLRACSPTSAATSPDTRRRSASATTA